MDPEWEKKQKNPFSRMNDMQPYHHVCTTRSRWHGKGDPAWTPGPWGSRTLSKHYFPRTLNEKKKNKKTPFHIWMICSHTMMYALRGDPVWTLPAPGHYLRATSHGPWMGKKTNKKSPFHISMICSHTIMYTLREEPVWTLYYVRITCYGLQMDPETRCSLS